MSTLIEHLESSLGRMGGGWPVTNASGRPLAIAYFDDVSIPGVGGYSTVGLSSAGLSKDGDDRKYHLELIALQYGATTEASPLPHILEFIAKELLSSHSPVFRGEVFRLTSPVVDGGTMTGIYVASPVYFADTFHSVHLEDGRGVAIAWMVPVHENEIKFVEQHGFKYFEQELVAKDPDLLDITRKSMFD